jgi:hypothetical protein
MPAAADADKMASPLAAELGQLLRRAADLPPVSRLAVAAVLENLLAEGAVTAVEAAAAQELLAVLEAACRRPSAGFRRAA